MKRRDFITLGAKSAALLMAGGPFAKATLAAAAPVAPRFTRALRGRLESLPAVAGAKTLKPGLLANRPALVTFFASWCPPCTDEFLNLGHVHREFAEHGLNIVAVNVFEAWDDNDAARMQAFLERTQPPFAALVGNASIREAFGGIDRIPTVYGFDKAGLLQYRFIHRRGASKMSASHAELKQAAESLVSEL